MSYYYPNEPEKQKLYKLISDVVLSINRTLNPGKITPQDNFVEKLGIDSMDMWALIEGIQDEVTKKYSKKNFTIPIQRTNKRGEEKSVMDMVTIDNAVNELYEILFE